MGSLERPVVSVVIVNFNGGPLLTEAVRAALCSNVSVEVFVSDNGSKDGSLISLQSLCTDPRLRIIENQANLGFSRGNNVALRQAVGDYILLLNPDCIVQADTLARMLSAMADHPQTVMAGCLLRNPDGTEQAGCRRSVPSPWRTLVRVLHLNRLFPNHPHFRHHVLTQEPLPDKPIYLEAISGAFMLMQRVALEQIGWLDEGYFLHCEDLDLCMQFRRLNRRILFVPDVEVVHYKGTCSTGRPIRVLWHKHRGMVRFYRKFFRHQYPSALMALVVMAVWCRFFIIMLATLVKLAGSRKPISSARVITPTMSARALRTFPNGDKREISHLLSRVRGLYKLFMRKSSVHHIALSASKHHQDAQQHNIATLWPTPVRGKFTAMITKSRTRLPQENREGK